MAYESKRFTPKKAGSTDAAGSPDTGSDTAESNATAAVTAAKEKLAKSSLGRSAAAGDAAAKSAAERPGRYTPRVPKAEANQEPLDSPAWVTYLMFALFGIGLLVIVLNYTNVIWDTNNTALLVGLGVIVAGFITATKVR
jgi:hypothetical protein